MKNKKPILTWDTCDITEYAVKDLLEQGPELTEDEAHERVYNDSDLFDMEWECLCDRLTEEMEHTFKSEYLYCEGCNMGWMHRNGHKYFRADSGEKLLHEVLPKTDCTFKIFKYGKTLVINNAHHDAPTGGEIYIIKQATQKEINGGYYD